jgi:hypothetical protein
MAQVGNSGTGTTSGRVKSVKDAAQVYTVPNTARTQPVVRGGYSAAPASASAAPFGGGGGDYYGGGYDGGGMAPTVSAPSEEDYLAGDSGYQTQISALKSALQRYLADSEFQKSNYMTDYNRSLRDLGYNEGDKQWNWNDPLTASGKGYQNQLNDFASRGMLQSQGYADAYQELVRMLNQQYDAMSGNKTTFMNDLDRQIANYKGENTSNQQAARAEALARRSAQYSL